MNKKRLLLTLVIGTLILVVLAFLFLRDYSRKQIGVSLKNNVGLNQVEKGIFELEHIGMQIQAVEIEMSLYLAQEEKDSPNYKKGASIKPAKKAVYDLGILKDDLLALVLPRELKELKPQFIEIIDKLSGIYNAVARKSKIDLEEEFKAFWSMVEAYNKNFKLKIDSFVKAPEYPKDFNLLMLESSLFKKQDDRRKFRIADQYISKKENYQKAIEILRELLLRYKGTLAEGSIIVRLVDAIEADRPDSGQMADPEYTFKLLDAYMLKKSYSPQISRIYLQWRTINQSLNSGFSNWSGIPNDEYIKVLWGLVSATERYIETHPNDGWAKLQLLTLLDTRLIERWSQGYPYGSTVAIDYYTLWGKAP